ncbi:class I SAM-dependent methyltransferase [Georgenia halophila]|uniref:Class I SAM-dependent methyltransferase n=1 Tax=Georgenia halophila TaxID=620889 RepID=A0ABP8L4W6_9MICO
MTSSRFEAEVVSTDYMLRLAASDLGRSYKSMVRGQLGLRPGSRVLDVGCGPGADLPDYAELVGPSGAVVGVDHDDTAVEAARKRTLHLPQVQVHIGDGHRLNEADESFDAAHTDRVLQHVFDPAEVLAEVARVLRPGGAAAFAEPDWETLVVDHPEPRLSTAYTRYVTEFQVRNARIGRQLAGFANDAGLAVRTIIPITTVFDDAGAADKVLGLHRVTRRAIEHEVMTPDEGQRWLDHLSGAQTFFAAVSLFVVCAVKPSTTVGSRTRTKS